MRLILIICAGIVLIYIFSGNNNSTRISSDNYGQYDKGTAMCDKGAYGDVNNLCD